MAKSKDSSDEKSAPEPDVQVDAQARDQTGQRQVRLRINEAAMSTNYANAFRTNTSAEEVIVDFGMNVLSPSPQGGAAPDGKPATVGEIMFNVDNRVVLNYYTAKRLAVMLAQVVRRHEEQFGELKLNASERVKVAPPASNA